MKKILKQKAFFQYTLLIGVIIVSVVGMAKVSASGSLVGHWKFDESMAGSNALDSSGNGNHGIPNTYGNSLPTPSNDVPPAITFYDPHSASFDGDNYYMIDRPVEDDFTICAWVKTSSAGSGPNHWETAPIMDSEIGGVINDFGFGIASDGTLAYGNGDTLGNDSAVYGSTVVNDNQWHNVCVSRDSNSGAVVLYVDAQVDNSGFTSPGTLDANPQAMIGYGFDGAALFNGLIDDVRTYNVVLTQAQLANLLSGSNNPNASGDGDGVDANTETAAPNSGDANNDGSQDSQQASVSSFINTQTGSYISVDGSNTCDLSALNSVSSASLVAADVGHTYPAGLVNYTANCGTNGYTATITLYFYGVTSNGLILRKYDPALHTYATVPGATISQVTIGGDSVTKVVYQVTDGGPLDSDGMANGVIVDPVGLASPAVVASLTSAAPLTLKAPSTGVGSPAQVTHSLLLAILSLPVALIGLAYCYRQYRSPHITAHS